MQHKSPEWVFSRCTNKLCISSTASANSKTCFEYRKKFLVAVTLLLASFMMRFTHSSIDCFGTSKLLNMSDTSCRPMRWSSTCTRQQTPSWFHCCITTSWPRHPCGLQMLNFISSVQISSSSNSLLFCLSVSLWSYQTNVLYAILITKMNAICPALCNLLNLTTLIGIKFLAYYI